MKPQNWEQYDQNKLKTLKKWYLLLSVYFGSVLIAGMIIISIINVSTKPEVALNGPEIVLETTISVENNDPIPGIDYPEEWLVNAIYQAEGGKKTKYPFGIRSVKCRGYGNCKKICQYTIRNNIGRYKKYGHKKYDTYLEFLASRYAPPNVANDPTNLNQNWLKNVKYFLEKEQL